MGLEFIKNAGVDHKITFIQSDCLQALDKMLSVRYPLIMVIIIVYKCDKIRRFKMTLVYTMMQENPKPEFDFAFVDADKPDYANIHERLMKLVKVGGIIAFDNTLWFGFVAEEKEESVPEHLRVNRKALMDLNKKLASDPRIELSQVSIGDGVTLCRRIV